MPLRGRWLEKLHPSPPATEFLAGLKGMRLIHKFWQWDGSRGHLCCAMPNGLVMSDSLRPPGLQPTRLLCPQGFSRQKYWSGVTCFLSGDHLNPGIKPRSPNTADRLLPTSTREAQGSSQFSRSVLSDSLQPHGLQHTRLPCPSPTHHLGVI